MGLTFQENCADLRNSKVVDISHELVSYGLEVFVHDPEADPEEALHEYCVHLLRWDEPPHADAIVAAVAHADLRKLPIEHIERKLVKGGCFIDVKTCFDAAAIKAHGLHVWRL